MSVCKVVAMISMHEQNYGVISKQSGEISSGFSIYFLHTADEISLVVPPDKMTFS
ncbi:hypothetical protein [Reichenbachiella sp.]